MREQWLLKQRNREVIEKLKNDLNIDLLTSILLVNRDIRDTEKAKEFLFGGIEDLNEPYLMKDMEKGVNRVKEAIENGSKITIYGDYDCDGVSSTSILYKGLERCGANFNYHIPDREDEGYGMNSNRVRILKEEGTELILTCDNGIAAFEEIALANELGMDVILTDHHDIPLVKNENGELVKEAPKAFAVINPKQDECEYPFKSLCGAGIAFKFMCALYRELGISQSETLELLEICAIATVCDVVDLLGENRVIVKKGLELLNNTSNKGLIALKKYTGLSDKEISQYHLGFVIGPCINATGRLETADLSVDLLLTKNDDIADALAKELFELNQRRQDLTKDSVDMVIKQIEDNNMEKDKVILVYNPYIHESIAGIVAGRIKEKYNVPTIIMTKGKDMPKGSARSIEEYNIFEELSKCKELISKFGGHPMAAGLSVEEKNIPLLRKMLLEKCELTDKDIIPKVRIDAKVPLESLNYGIIDNLEKLEPFGKGNASPLFGEKDVKVSRVWIMGKDKNVIKFRCKLRNSYKTLDAIAFGNKVDDFKEDFKDKYGEEELLRVLEGGSCNFGIDLIYYPNINEFNGNKSIQANVKYFRI
ncbi:single-stranded-DNA-specific exonuclease RecJ [Clostridium sp. B9]|uniref:single-stranded-DNA-specific exonuclease RecJ n=1 Tax=Clostridium sp. B9 TaxID=3423224 RepID=UPI003D2F0836